jgi:alanine racemase
MNRGAAAGRLLVDLDALARNYRKLCATAKPAECAAVVKADAYGLGVAPIARRLAREGCRSFFVATVAEGCELRALDPSAAIYVLDGATPDDVAALVEHTLRPVLSSYEQAECWARASARAPAALHIDTGMSRLGLSAREVEQVAADAALLERLDVVLVMTHFACADETDHEMNREQLGRFAKLRRLLPRARTSIASSAGLFIDAAHRGDVVRPGIALYGGNPFTGRGNPMEPVASLHGRILQVREIDEACTVGYGATYLVSPPARIAVVGVGYADGYPRRLGNRAVAALGGVRVPVIGRVSMDLLCVDVTGVPPERARVGGWVELFGAVVTLDEIAAAAGTISYEILTGLGSRLEREYVEQA